MKTPRRLTSDDKRTILAALGHSLEAIGVEASPELAKLGGLGYAITAETTIQTVLASYRRRMGRDPIAYHAALPNLLILENLT